MRHRIGCAAQTGLGNPLPVRLKNEWTDDKKLNALIGDMLQEGMNLWFPDYNGIDYNIDINRTSGNEHIEVAFGIEPAYQMDPLKIIIVNSNLQWSSFTKGIAYGYYGSNIVQTYKRYSEYKRSCKFKDFAEKWSKKLADYTGLVVSNELD